LQFPQVLRQPDFGQVGSHGPRPVAPSELPITPRVLPRPCRHPVERRAAEVLVGVPEQPTNHGGKRGLANLLGGGCREFYSRRRVVCPPHLVLNEVRRPFTQERLESPHEVAPCGAYRLVSPFLPRLVLPATLQCVGEQP